MSRRIGLQVALFLVGSLAMPAAADWRCIHGQVELIVGGAHGCASVAPPPPARTAPLVSQHMRDQERRAVLEAELRQERASLLALQQPGAATDPTARQRVQDNIDALQRELGHRLPR